MGLLAIKFAKEHHNVMPHDLGQTLASKPDVDAAIYLTVADLNAHPAPSPLTAEWVNKNTSYIYLAADASMNKPPPDPNMHWNDVVMAYTKDPFRFGPHSTFMVNLVFMDGRTETDSVDQAKPRIAESINALRSVTDTDKSQK